MIVVGAGSGNNLVYSLAFLLLGIAMLTMIATNYNLKGVELELLQIEDGFADETAVIYLSLRQNSARSRHYFRVFARGPRRPLITVIETVQPRTGRAFGVSVPLAERGICPVPMIQIETIYPLGFFRAWKWVRPEGQIFVFPRRQGLQPLPMPSAGEGMGLIAADSRETHHEDFREHAKYLPGQSQHHVDWKAFARRGVMLTKKYDTTVPEHFVLRWQDVPGSSDESRLEQLSRWIDDLAKTDGSFELQLPNAQTEIGQGAGFVKQVLRRLAQFPKAKAAA